MPQPTAFELISTICFGLAVLHTFSVKQFQNLAHKYKEGTIGENFFHLMGEVEVVFGLWAGIFFVAAVTVLGYEGAVQYLNSRNFTEPAFVFVIMVVCATRPIMSMAESAIGLVARILPLPKPVALYFATLTIGPLLGSFVTEPAAMTITALLLLKEFYSHRISDRLKYASIGLLFVNISIGGTLTPFAAPPVLVVASTWGWDLSFMLSNFAWRAALAVSVNSALIAGFFYRELKNLPVAKQSLSDRIQFPAWVGVMHLIALILIVAVHQHLVLFLGLFLFFLGLVAVTKEYQIELRLKESLLVAFFFRRIGGAWWTAKNGGCNR